MEGFGCSFYFTKASFVSNIAIWKDEKGIWALI